MSLLNEKEIIVRLKEIVGLNTYEARAYLTLLKLGEARPLEISKEASIPHQRIYDVLRSLEAKGFIVEKSGMYMPVDPTESFKAVSSRILMEANIKAKEIEELGKSIEKIAERSRNEEGLAIIKGLINSIAEAISLTKTCDEAPSFMTYKAAERVLEYWYIFKDLVNALPEKTKIIIPANIDVPRSIVNELKKRNVQLHRSAFSILDFMVACDTVIIGLPSGEKDVVSVIIKNRAFAKAIKERLEEIVRLPSPTS